MRLNLKMNLPVVVKSTGMLTLFLFKAARKAEFLENSFEVVTFPIWLDICWVLIKLLFFMKWINVQVFKGFT